MRGNSGDSGWDHVCPPLVVTRPGPEQTLDGPRRVSGRLVRFTACLKASGMGCPLQGPNEPPRNNRSHILHQASIGGPTSIQQRRVPVLHSERL